MKYVFHSEVLTESSQAVQCKIALVSKIYQPMTQAILNQILNQLEALEPEELQELNQAIQKYLVTKDKDTVETKFHQALLTSGLIKQLKESSSTQQTKRRLIQIQGKPISETIIEERR